VPLYLSEMAPARRRGAVTIAFHLGASFGLLSAQVTNYFTAKISEDDNAFGCAPRPPAELLMCSVLRVAFPHHAHALTSALAATESDLLHRQAPSVVPCAEEPSLGDVLQSPVSAQSWHPEPEGTVMLLCGSLRILSLERRTYHSVQSWQPDPWKTTSVICAQVEDISRGRRRPGAGAAARGRAAARQPQQPGRTRPPRSRPRGAAARSGQARCRLLDRPSYPKQNRTLTTIGTQTLQADRNLSSHLQSALQNSIPPSALSLQATG